MKKILIPAIILLLLAGGAGGYYALGLGGTPMSNARDLLAKGDTKGATIELRNAIKADPSDGEAHFRLGEIQLRGGDPIAAEKELKLARGLNYDAGAVTPLLGAAYMAQRRFEDLLADVPDTGATPEQTGRLLLLRSQAQAAMRDLTGAALSLGKAEQAAPKDVDIRIAQTRLLLANKDPAGAERAIDQAIAIDPKRGDALATKGQLRVAAGDLPGGLTLMDQAVGVTPDLPAIRLERANLLMNMGDNAKAQSDVDAVLKAEPRNAPGIYLNGVLMIRAGKFADADAELTKLGNAAQLFPRALYFEALAKANNGQTEQAVEGVNRYIAKYPADSEGVRLLARIEISAKRPARAIEALNRAVAAGVKDPETLDLLGRAYAAAGLAPQAAETFQQASNAAPKDPAILTNLAASKMQLGDSSGASKALERSLEIAPNQSTAGEALVATALSSGDIERAKTALERLRKQSGETQAVGMLSALIRLAQQDLEGARVEFEALSKKFPDAVDPKLNLAKVLMLQNKRPAGEALLREILAKDPANPPALNTLMQSLVQENHLSEAVEAVEVARKAHPQDAALTVVESDLLVKSGDSKKALEVLDASRVNGQLTVPLRLAQARAQFANGAKEDTKASYRQILLLQPTELEARRALTEILINDKDYPGAEAVLQEGLRASPGNLGMMQTMVMIEQRAAGVPAAIKMAEDLRKDPANMPAAVVLKGDAYMAAQRYGDAAGAYAAENRIAPTAPLVLRQAQALAASGGVDQAAEVLREWLRTNPTDADAAQVLASYDIIAHRLPDAEQHLKIVLDKRPNDGQALNNIAWVYQQRGNGLAQQFAQRAYLLAPSPETADTLGWILVSNGQAGKGAPLLQQALIGRPHEHSIEYHLAKAEFDLGHKDEAMKLAQASLDGQVEFDERPAALRLLEQLKGK